MGSNRDNRKDDGARSAAQDLPVTTLPSGGNEPQNDPQDGDLDIGPEVERADRSLTAGYLLSGASFSPPTVAGFMLPISRSATQVGHRTLTKDEREEAMQQERDLLTDNGIFPDDANTVNPKPPGGIFEHFRPRQSVDSALIDNDYPSETTALLRAESGQSNRRFSRKASIPEQWADAVAEGKIATTWKREALVLSKFSWPLIVAHVLQYSLIFVSVLTVGHLGKNELGAVSLANMTANITGYCLYEGLVTSLDTLCAQAYGSGKLHLVGLQTQRVVFFLWAATIPIAVIWLFGTQILSAIIPEQEIAELAGLFLKILIFGAPGFAAFEAGKRFLQAQGLFTAILYILILCASANAFMNWFFVWYLNWGFVGAPIAVAISNNLLPLCLCLYVYFIAGRECWGGFTKHAFQNWGPMISLALPGLVMVAAEFFAFEILTLGCSYISTTALAAQSVLQSIAIITFQSPFSLSIAASTRIANLVGAGLADAGKICVRVVMVMALGSGLFNMVFLTALSRVIPKLFTNDADVNALIIYMIPLFATFQLFDALTANCNGILRGLGRQKVGGWVNLFGYYVIGVPVSFGLAFGARLGLLGLWLGPSIALVVVGSLEMWFIYHTNWDRVLEDASQRNESDEL